MTFAVLSAEKGEVPITVWECPKTFIFFVVLRRQKDGKQKPDRISRFAQAVSVKEDSVKSKGVFIMFKNKVRDLIAKKLMEEAQEIYVMIGDRKEPISLAVPVSMVAGIAEALAAEIAAIDKDASSANGRYCIYCGNSCSADAPDGSQVLICFNAAGNEGRGKFVGDLDTCDNYNGS